MHELAGGRKSITKRDLLSGAGHPVQQGWLSPPRIQFVFLTMQQAGERERDMPPWQNLIILL